MHTEKQTRTPEGQKPARAAARTPAPGGGLPARLLALQSSAGNAAVVQTLRREGHPWAQPQQHQHGAGCGHRPTGQPAVQRSAVHDVLRAGGRPLDAATRTDMESRLGADFSDVRIHNDSAARASAAEVGARAYTSGSHVVIGEGGADRHTLAHELTHVIQQRKGPVSGTDNGNGLSVSDPSDRFEREAEANATRVMSAAPAVRQAESRPSADTAPQPPASGTALQRMMPGYKRKGITRTATNELLEYQGATPNAPGSPRAAARLAALQNGNPNHWDTNLAANWAITGRIGQDTAGNDISRNHRLSDHYVGHIVDGISATWQGHAALGNPVPANHQAAVDNFVTACVPSGNAPAFQARLQQVAMNPTRQNFRDIVSDVSNNGRNLRAGDSRINSGIGAHWDPGLYAATGTMTPISEEIHGAVTGLGTAGVIDMRLVNQALQQHRAHDTSSDRR